MKHRVGIFTYGDDLHGHWAKKKIEEQHGAWCCLIPCDELALRGRLTWSTQGGEPALLPTVDDVGLRWRARTTVCRGDAWWVATVRHRARRINK